MIGVTEVVIIAVGVGLLVLAPQLFKKSARNIGETLSEFKAGLDSNKKSKEKETDSDSENSEEEEEEEEENEDSDEEDSVQAEYETDEEDQSETLLLEAPKKRRVVKKVVKGTPVNDDEVEDELESH